MAPTEFPSGDSAVPSEGPKGEVLEGSQGAVECQRPQSGVKVAENRIYSGNAHAHDEWGGATEKVIFDGDVTRFAGGGWFEMPGAVVIPGSGRMKFKIGWSQLPAADARTLQYDMPGDEKSTSAMYSLVFETPGQEKTVELNISNNDPPHYAKTTWTFKIVEAKQIHITWTIFRTYECLPIDPPHYDQWNGDTYRVFWETSTTHDAKYACPPGQGSTGGIDGGCSGSGVFYGHQPKENTTVPLGPERMVVTLRWTADPSYGQKLGLAVAPPTTRGGSTAATWERVTSVKEVNANTREFEKTLAPEEWDTPYASKTAWSFTFYIDNGNLYAAVGDTGAFKGTINWKVEIYWGA
ncbi:MAG: hypothetical protein HYT80_01405 [Euryarchaeota archaeon]|nr:hypothetical protein [Euryarchaeota archaeon]